MKETFHSLILRIQNETSPRPSYSEACKIAAQRSAQSHKARKQRAEAAETAAREHFARLEQMKLL